MSAHKYLRFKEVFILARFALHVVDGVGVFNVGIKAENHAIPTTEFLKMPTISDPRERRPLDTVSLRNLP
jgi:hypothetical protein